MIYLQLFLSYLKIGFFGFGGGYSMLQLIHHEVVTQHGWISSAALSDIVAISQMTPGPIAINSATYIGYTVAGIGGAIVATIAVCLPSLTIMALITRYFLRLKGNRYVDCVMATMKPVVLAMIGAASLLLIFPADNEAASMIDTWSWVLFGVAFVASLKKIDPIKLIVLSAVAGIAIYYRPVQAAEVATPTEQVQRVTIEQKVFEGFDLTNPATITSAEFEQTFVNYIAVLGQTNPSSANESLKGLMAESSTSKEAMLNLYELSERYLYDPNSPMRNEELFIPILESVISSESLESIEKIRPKKLLETVMKNRVGEIATDFEYTTESGENLMMHDVDATYTMLFFNNPDCEECARVKQIIESYSPIAQWVSQHHLAILSVYPDVDLAVWFAATYPSTVINSYDATCATSQLYDLKAIPTIYLLDSEKRVILKDVSIEQALYYLRGVLISL